MRGALRAQGLSADRNQSTLEKLVRAREGDKGAREELVEENLALVRFLVRRFAGRGVESEDLFQYGCMGLLKAIDRFDPQYEVRFSTYAVPVILGEIKRYLRDDGPVHVSRTIHDNARRVGKFCEEWRMEHQEEPNISQVAEGLKMSREDVLLALNAKMRVRSLNEPVTQDGELRLMDVLGADCMQEVDTKLTLSRLLRDLAPEERTLILRRYFQSHTQTQIAKDMGISQVQVSRIESRIIRKLRAAAGEE